MMMEASASNPFLARVMSKIRLGRPELPAAQPYFNRVEQVPAGRYAEIWFRTGGCQWDLQGGCTMCNYGAGAAPSAELMIASIGDALTELDGEFEELMISPSGSILDPVEVPPEVRVAAYRLAARYPKRKFLIETRSEWVGDDTMAELRRHQPADQQVAVEIGLESADPWILRFCVNKGCNPQGFVAAAEAAHRHGVDVYANVSLGTAFLSPVEAIEDCVRGVTWALDSGATHAVVFPIHIKPFTLHDLLSGEGRIESPSLWSLVEVLRRLGPARVSQVEIAWYKSYYDTAAKVRRSPSTCPRCQAQVIELLDAYRSSQTWEAVQRLVDFSCPCKEDWRSTLDIPVAPLALRVEQEYWRLAEKFGLTAWLESRSDLLADLRTSSSHAAMPLQ